MKASVISPTRFLQDFSIYKDNKYHMVLAHRFLTDRVYKDFYITQRERGAYIILDNGACELKSSISDNKLVEAIRTLKPNLMVLPDVLNDGEATIQRSFQFLNSYKSLLKEHKTDLVAVPQGTTLSEWLASFDIFYRSPAIKVLGISSVKALNVELKAYFDRSDALEFLMNKGYPFTDKKVHILGMGDSGHEEMKKLQRFKFVEGIDTSAPVVHGYYSVKFTHGNNYKKIPLYLPDDLQVMSPEQIELIKHNIDVIYDSRSS